MKNKPNTVMEEIDRKYKSSKKELANYIDAIVKYEVNQAIQATEERLRGNKLELLTIQWEFPVGLTGTSAPIQYAYFINKKGKVIKKEVKQ